MTDQGPGAAPAPPWAALYDDHVPLAFAPALRNGVELFERGPRERPEEAAILYFETAISHREAGDLAHALAAALSADLGLEPGDRVALMLQNVPQMAIAVHAVWLAGGVVSTVNPMNKRRELEHQLNDAGVRIAFCLESLYAALDAVRDTTPLRHIVTASELDHLDAVPDALSEHERRPCPGGLAMADLLAAHAGERVAPSSPEPGDPALVTYTSGTTGISKGAVNTHGAIVHNAEAMTRWFDLGPGDVTVAMAPLFHITGLVCHLATARTSLTPLLLLHRFEPGEILRLIERWRGTYVIGPLTAFIAMLAHPDFAARDLSSLTKVASGGAPVNPATVERWERATGAYMHNTYGLTESAAPCHLVPAGARSPVDPESGALSIGVPIPNTAAKIVGIEDGAELAAGEIGEIVVRGPGVTSGYWRRPEESAHALRSGWLHTGDVGKRDEQGWFYVVDRIKDMINVSGYKVWPRDVEDVLYQHPAVLEACVVGVPDDYRGETVRAYVTLKAGREATPDQLIAHCREALAAYKAPCEVAFLDEIPKTLTGKALRRELRERG
ncbi:MAG: AMP-binding protein [Solirubrobacterales bacterium]